MGQIAGSGRKNSEKKACIVIKYPNNFIEVDLHGLTYNAEIKTYTPTDYIKTISTVKIEPSSQLIHASTGFRYYIEADVLRGMTTYLTLSISDLEGNDLWGLKFHIPSDLLKRELHFISTVSKIVDKAVSGDIVGRFEADIVIEEIIRSVNRDVELIVSKLGLKLKSI